MIIRKNETKTDIASYLRAVFFGHVHSTFIKSIKTNQFTTCPGLTSKVVTKHISTIITTTKLHINQERLNLQSTKYPSPMIQIKDEDNYDNFFPLSDAPNVESHYSEYTILEFTPK